MFLMKDWLLFSGLNVTPKRSFLTDAGIQETVREIVIAALGHEEPTLLITNQLSRSTPLLIQRYAQWMLIENSIEDGIDFFHMDALSSATAMKVNCDLQLTFMASRKGTVCRLCLRCWSRRPRSRRYIRR
jgi:hypothetical protein